MEDPWTQGRDPWAQSYLPRQQNTTRNVNPRRNWQAADSPPQAEATKSMRCANCDATHNLWHSRKDSEYYCRNHSVYCTACWRSWGWRDWDEGLAYDSRDRVFPRNEDETQTEEAEGEDGERVDAQDVPWWEDIFLEGSDVVARFADVAMPQIASSPSIVLKPIEEELEEEEGSEPNASIPWQQKLSEAPVGSDQTRIAKGTRDCACVCIQTAWRCIISQRASLFQQYLAQVVILGAGKPAFSISARSWTEFHEQLEQCGIPQDEQHPHNFEISGSIQEAIRIHPCFELVNHELWLILQMLPMEVRPQDNLDHLTEIVLRLHEPATVLYRKPSDRERGSLQIDHQFLANPVTSGMLEQIVSSQSFAPSPRQWHQKRAGVQGTLHRITAVWGLPAAGSPCSQSIRDQSAEGLILAAAEDIGRTSQDVQEFVRRIVGEEWFATVKDLHQITAEQWESMRSEMRIPRNLVLAMQNRLRHNQDMNLVGLNLRVGRALYGAAKGIEDQIEQRTSILIIGQPGTGKSTILREMTRLCAELHGNRVVVVDTTSELGGFGVRPHTALGSATRVSVKCRSDLFTEMLNAVANLSAAVVVIDEIRDADEVMAARTIANEGVALLATAHGRDLAQLVHNPTLNPLLGGVDSAAVGDLRMRETRCASKFNSFRKGEPAFQTVLVIQSDGGWSIYEDVPRAVDAILGAQFDDGARLFYPRARQGFADTDDCADTGSTSSGSVEVQRAGVEKVPARLLARLCSGNTYLCCFDGGVKWNLHACDAGAGACIFRVKTDGRSNEHLFGFDRTVFMTDEIVSVDKAELAGMLAGIFAFHELRKELDGCLAFVCEGDNKPLIGHVREAVEDPTCNVELKHAADLQRIFLEIVKQLSCLKADGVQVWLRWRPRRFNKVADRLARQARLERKGTWSHEVLQQNCDLHSKTPRCTTTTYVRSAQKGVNDAPGTMKPVDDKSVITYQGATEASPEDIQVGQRVQYWSRTHAQFTKTTYGVGAKVILACKASRWISLAEQLQKMKSIEGRAIRARTRTKENVEQANEVQSGEMRGVAFEGTGNIRQEFSNGDWHAVPVKVTKLVAEKPLIPSSGVPGRAATRPSGFGTSSGSTSLGTNVGGDRGVGMEHIQRHPPVSTLRHLPAAPAALDTTAVTTVVVNGFSTKILNTIFEVDMSIVIGGRSTYWDQDRRFFMYYQASERRWAISCRDGGGGDDLLLDAQRGGIRGLAYEEDKEKMKWREFFEGHWITIQPQIKKLNAAGQQTGVVTAPAVVVPHTRPREAPREEPPQPLLTIKVEDNTPVPTPTQPLPSEMAPKPAPKLAFPVDTTGPSSNVVCQASVVTLGNAGAEAGSTFTTSSSSTTDASGSRTTTTVDAAPESESPNTSACAVKQEQEEHPAVQEAGEDEKKKLKKQEKKEKKHRREKELEARLKDELRREMQEKMKRQQRRRDKNVDTTHESDTARVSRRSPFGRKKMRKEAPNSSTGDAAAGGPANSVIRVRKRWPAEVSACWPEEEKI